MRDFTWYLKWVGTAILIVGTLINSLGYYPTGPLMLSAGGILWLIVSIRWREPALIATNAVMFICGAGGLIWRFFV
jgi:hypothetical protein